MNYIKGILLTIGLIAVMNLHGLSQTVEQPQKKTEFEVSIGLGGIKPESIYARTTGLDALISQYASLYGVNHSASGTDARFNTLVPFNLSANYFLGGDEFKWFLKGGITFGSKSIVDTKSYQVTWPGFTETHDYNMTNRISYVIPHAGIGVRYTSFDFYGALGLAFTRFNYTEEYSYSEPGLSSDITDDFKVKGTAPAVILGIKYRKQLSRKKPGLNAFVKLEAMLLKLNTLKGTKTTTGISGQGSSATIDGTLYTFQWNPYQQEWFDYWDIVEGASPVSDSYTRNYEKMSLQLSGIRIMIGISF